MKAVVKKKKHRKVRFSKKYFEGKIGFLAILLITIGFFAYFIASHMLQEDKSSTLIQSEPESFAAGKVSSTESLVLVEAENMSYLSAPDGIQTFEDATASGGSGKMLAINNTILTTINLESPASKLILRAKGHSCHGGPNAVVSIGGVPLMDKKISSTSWHDYATNVSLDSGSYSLTITFNNDFTSSSGQGCNRDLMLDKVTLQ